MTTWIPTNQRAWYSTDYLKERWQNEEEEPLWEPDEDDAPDWVVAPADDDEPEYDDEP